MKKRCSGVKPSMSFRSLPASERCRADLLRVPVIRPRVTETTALGAAYLAGLAIGFWKNRAEIAAQWAESRRFRPAPNRAAMKKLQSIWHRAVARAKDWA